MREGPCAAVCRPPPCPRPPERRGLPEAGQTARLLGNLWRFPMRPSVPYACWEQSRIRSTIWARVEIAIIILCIVPTNPLLFKDKYITRYIALLHFLLTVFGLNESTFFKNNAVSKLFLCYSLLRHSSLMVTLLVVVETLTSDGVAQDFRRNRLLVLAKNTRIITCWNFIIIFSRSGSFLGHPLTLERDKGENILPRGWTDVTRELFVKVLRKKILGYSSRLKMWR